MIKLDEQWVEELYRKKHMLKAIENTIGGCKGCDLQKILKRQSIKEFCFDLPADAK